MSSASSAAEMIRRFREGPPISREDRAAAVADGNAPHNMWWSTANKRGGEGNDISLRKDSHSHISAKSDPLEHSEGSEPRIGSTLQRPEPAASRSISPMSRIAKYEGELHYLSSCSVLFCPVMLLFYVENATPSVIHATYVVLRNS